MELFSIDTDNVIKGLFITGRVTYRYALDNLIHLINQLDIQRKIQNETFYKRLEKDYQKGCITPAITLAFIQQVDLLHPPSLKNVESNIEKNIRRGFILDGIQRLNTLKRVADTPGNSLELERYLYLNIIVCESRDNLLYRMVTLNNGQKPMTARHQIEILAESIYNFEDYGLKVYTEKDPQNERSDKNFKKADLINAYISFLSNSTNLDNKRIIEEKLDELVARKIIESKITDSEIDFSRVLNLIQHLCDNNSIYEWLKNGNTLIGFCVGIRDSIEYFEKASNDEVESALQRFESAFKNLNVSKIKLSRERRKLVSYFISNFPSLSQKDSTDLTLILADQH